MSTALFHGPSPAAERVYQRLAKAFRPRTRERPSAWAEKYVRLTGEQSPRPGPVRLDFECFQRAIMDAHFEEPHKRGVIGIKPGQVGWSTLMVMLMVCLACTDPGSFLYATTDQTKAEAFATREWGGMLRNSDAVREMLEATNLEDSTRKSAKFPGGFLDWFGAGGEGGLTSVGRKCVWLDEYDLASKNYMKGAGGDLWQAALVRTRQYKGMERIDAFAHPSFENDTIHKLWCDWSDRRRWVFDCPRTGCAGPIFPRFDLIRIEGIKQTDGPADAEELAKVDPAKSWLRCPHCGEKVTDAERAAALWEPQKGGTGRFESELSAEEAGGREWIGLWITSLCSHRTTVAELVKRWSLARSDEQRLEFFGKGCGEPYRSNSAVVPIDLVESRVQTMERIVVPGGALGVHAVTAGVDVQAPEEHPTLYTQMWGWSAAGHGFLLACEKLSGWAAFFEYLRTAYVWRAGEDGGAEERLGIECVGIDCGAWTGQVLTQSRTEVYSSITGGQVQMIPLRYAGHIKSTLPAVLPPDVKRIDPANPHRGMIERYDLHRNTWVNRHMRRWLEKRATILCDPPPDLQGHLSANVQRPIQNVHGWQSATEFEWVKADDGLRDDWFQAGAYAECVAALKRDLNTIHEHAHAAGVGMKPMTREEYEREYGRGRWRR